MDVLKKTTFKFIREQPEVIGLKPNHFWVFLGINIILLMIISTLFSSKKIFESVIIILFVIIIDAIIYIILLKKSSNIRKNNYPKIYGIYQS